MIIAVIIIKIAVILVIANGNAVKIITKNQNNQNHQQLVISFIGSNVAIAFSQLIAINIIPLCLQCSVHANIAFSDLHHFCQDHHHPSPPPPHNHHCHLFIKKTFALKQGGTEESSCQRTDCIRFAHYHYHHHHYPRHHHHYPHHHHYYHHQYHQHSLGYLA